VALQLALDPDDKRCGFCQLRDLRRAAKKQGKQVWVRFESGGIPLVYVYGQGVSLNRLRTDRDYASNFGAGPLLEDPGVKCSCPPEAAEPIKVGDQVRLKVFLRVVALTTEYVTVELPAGAVGRFTIRKDWVKRVK